MPLIYLSSSWVAGVFLGSQFSPHFLLTFSGFLPLLLLLFTRRRRAVILLSLSVFAFFGGAIRFQVSQPEITSSLSYFNGHQAELNGIIESDPEQTDKTTHIILSVHEIKEGNNWQKIEGKVLVFAPRYAGFQYGDILTVSGKLETPSHLDAFDYPAYLANHIAVQDNR